MLIVENGDTEKALIKWYWRSHELLKKSRKIKSQMADKIDPHEVFLDKSRMDDEVDVDTIIGKCEVANLKGI